MSRKSTPSPPIISKRRQNNVSNTAILQVVSKREPFMNINDLVKYISENPGNLYEIYDHPRNLLMCRFYPSDHLPIFSYFSIRFKILVSGSMSLSSVRESSTACFNVEADWS